MKSILVTGVSKGLGLEWTKQYLEKGDRVFGVSRYPQESEALRQLGEQFQKHLVVFATDVGDEDARRDFYRELRVKTECLDLVINNAGILSGNEEHSLSFGKVRQDDICKTFLINTVAPLMIVQEVFPLLRKGENPIVVNMSSTNGSISGREQGGKYSYCASKAALNMITKILSFDLKDYGIIVVALHPGWVKTWMTRKETAPLEPTESVEGMIRAIESMEMKDSGKFLDWKGKEIPW